MRFLETPIGFHPLDDWAFETAIQIEAYRSVDPCGAEMMDDFAATWLRMFAISTREQMSLFAPPVLEGVR